MARLTTTAVRTMQPGDVLHDDLVRGLQLRRRASATTWHLYYRIHGQERRPKLGDWPSLQIEAAREIGRQWLLQIAQGIDPSAEKQRLRESATVLELFEAWLADYATREKSPRSVAEDRLNFSAHVAPAIGKRKAATLTASDLQRVLDAAAVVRYVTPMTASGRPWKAKVKRGGPVAANRVRALLSGLMTYAESEAVKIRPRGSNPIGETRKRPERSRTRHVRADEFARILAAMRSLEPRYPHYVAAIRCMMYCGARVSELLTARRSELRGHVLYLRHHKTARHTGAPREIVLPRQVLDIIDRLPQDSSGYLFGGGLNRYMARDVWAMIRTDAGCPDIQLRDMRRTFASVVKTAGGSLDAIGELLGHGDDPKVTAGYAYLFEEHKAALAQGAADQIDRLSLTDDPA